MKQHISIGISCVMLILLSACGKNINGTAIELNEIINSQSESAIISVSDEITKAAGYVKKTSIELFFRKYREDDSATSVSQNMSENDMKDPYVGEYNSFDVDEPDLEIQRNANGTYKIQIGIYRTAFMDDCVGKRTESGISFLVNWEDRDYRGIITFEDDIATVIFTTSDWTEYHRINAFKYYKTSDVPNIYEFY